MTLLALYLVVGLLIAIRMDQEDPTCNDVGSYATYTFCWGPMLVLILVLLVP